MTRIIIIFLLIICRPGIGQTLKFTSVQIPNVDSILKKFNIEKDEDIKVDLLLGLLCNEINNNPKWTIETGVKLLDQSKKNNSTIEMSYAYTFLGQGYRLLGNYIKSLDSHHKAVAAAEKSGNLSILAFVENQLAHIYRDREEYRKAISLYLTSTAHAEKGRNEKVKAWGPCNLGACYLAINSLDSSLMYSQRADEIFSRYKIEFIYPYIYTNLGGVQSKLGNSSLAVSYFNKAINQCAGTANVRYLNMAYMGLAEHYRRFDQKDSCTFYAKKAISVVTNTSFFYLSIKPAQMLSDIYLKTSCDSTLKYIKVYKSATDSLSSHRANQQILLMTFDEDMRQREAEYAKQMAISEEAKKKQKTIIWAIAGGLFFVLLFAAFILRSLRITRKQKAIIEQKEIITQRQKQLLQEKNKEISDSINYAQHLQRAILPPKELITNSFANSFVLYKPKDIVAGDFYWTECVNSLYFIAAADCTGHGVPGAMMSIVCSNALSRTVKEFSLFRTSEILNKTRELVIETFEKSNAEIKDGMDISLLCIDKQNQKIFWSGANNPLWYIQDSSLTEIKADKQPVGKSYDTSPFTTNVLEYKTGTTFYLFTDGLADQFGGPKGKKFKYKQFEETLVSINNLPLTDQVKIIDDKFEEWKGALDQVDDVCVIGIKI